MCRWEYIIKMGLREMEWVGLDWIHPAHVRDQWQAAVNMVMNFQVR
jgi:hypothetical protein